MVGELSLPEMLKILGANGWKSDAARVVADPGSIGLPTGSATTKFQ